MNKMIPCHRSSLKIRLWQIILFQAIACGAAGQKIIPSPQDIYHEAAEYMFAGEYKEALPLLMALSERGYNTANISFRTGECYLNIQGMKTAAIPYLQKAALKSSRSYEGDSLNEDKSPVKSILYLGIAYRLNYDFDNALASYHAYEANLDKQDTVGKALVLGQIARCANALELTSAPAQFKCDTLPPDVNSDFSNFNPVVSFDEKNLYYMDQLRFYDAVMNTRKQDTLWGKPENLTSILRSDGDHLITALSPDGTEMLLTVYDPYFSGEIYLSRLQEGQWGEMARLDSGINTRFNESHASFSPDGNYLYFTSDRPGGFGGSDIYRSRRKKDGGWEPAVNLGPVINTMFSEETPFITPQGNALFFSSQGHYNMGGFDIFFADIDVSGNFLPPVNVGYPINTTDDDLFFYPLQNGKIAYQARFQANMPLKHIVRYDISAFGNPSRFRVLGKVNVPGYPNFDPGLITIKFSDLRQKVLSAVKLNKDGKYEQKLPSGEFTIDFSQDDSLLLRKFLSIPAGFPGDQIVLNTDLMAIERTSERKTDSLRMHDILFAFDKSILDSCYHALLDRVAELMAEYPTLRLNINGYADSRGSDKYNLKLSHMRAAAVAFYLKKYTAVSDRIDVNGFGELNPAAINNNPDGTDNPRGRMYNRRVELMLEPANTVLNITKLNEIPAGLRIR